MDSLIEERPSEAIAACSRVQKSVDEASPALRPTPVGGEYLACRLGDEEYGIEILRVQEIRSYEPPTRIAGAPAHVLGVVNLRGLIVPVLDLRVKFGCASAGFGPTTVLVVLRLRERTVGAVVDAVSDVLRMEPGQISPPPEVGGIAAESGVAGIGTLGGGDRPRMLLLLDAELAAGGLEVPGNAAPPYAGA